MKLKTKTKYVLLAGVIFGGIWDLILIFFERSLNYMPDLLGQIIFFPATVGMFIAEIILWPICKLDTTNICRGLAFDSGPLAWIEWTGLFGGMIVGYGIIFVLIYKLYQRIK